MDLPTASQPEAGPSTLPLQDAPARRSLKRHSNEITEPSDSNSSRKRVAIEETSTVPASEINKAAQSELLVDGTGNAEKQVVNDEGPDYGAHHRVLLQALEVAVRKGANRWTAKDLKRSYPHLSTGREKSFEDAWTRSAQDLREKMMDQAQETMKHYELAESLLRLHQSLETARKRKEQVVSGEKQLREICKDAWRPDISPRALTIAYGLPRYDAVWTRLREEYIQLYKDCERLAGEVDKKKNRMDEIKDRVVQANKQLEATAVKMETIPTEEMKAWMEDVAGNDRLARKTA